MDIDRRDPGLILFSPLLILLLLVPGLLGRSDPGAGYSRHESDLAAALEAAAPDEPVGDDPLLAYLGVSPLPGNLEHLRGISIEHLILLLPDPLESRFDEIFDRHLAAAQQAIESSGFALDRFKLPWLDEKGAPQAEGRPYHDEPGVLLYRKDKHLLVVLVVGETSTAGVHRPAFENALRRIGIASPITRKYTIRILGPTFTGSLPSLELSMERLHLCAARPPFASRIQVISGSVTGVVENPFESCPNLRFQTTVLPDFPALEAFVSYVRREKGRGRIALLVESNTGYGRKLAEEIKKSHPDAIGEDDAPFLSLTYPVHVAELRKAIARHPRERSNGTPDMSSSRTELGSEDRPSIRETLPLFATDSIAATEMALDLLLESLSRELVSFLGIFASDQKDAFFLVEEIRRHVPTTILFLMDADTLQLHQDVNPQLRGAYVVSTYPLFPLNQNWSPPYTGDERRIVFPSQYAQGVYNAALYLLHDDPGRGPELLEYGHPFSLAPEQGPPLWVQAVGRSSYWPLTLLEPGGRGLSILAPTEAPATWDGLYFRGLETRQSAALLIILLVGLWWATLVLLVWTRRQRAGTPGAAVPQLLADSVSPELSTQRQSYLISLLVALALFTLVAVAINLLPVISALRLGWTPSEVEDWLAVLRACLVGGPAVTLVTICAMNLSSAPRSVFKELIVVGTIILAVPCVLLTADWLFWSEPAEQLFLYMRAVNWLNGASPLLPALFVAASGVLFLLCTLDRLRYADGLEKDETTLMAKNGSDRALIDLESLIRASLTSRPFHLRMAIESFLILVVIWIALFGLSWVPMPFRRGWDIGVTVQTYESEWYICFFALSYLGIYTCLGLAGLRLQLAWATLRRMHEHLVSTDSIGAFQDLFADDLDKRASGLSAYRQGLRAVRRSLSAAEEILREDGFREACAEKPEKDAYHRWILPARDALEKATVAAAKADWRRENVSRRSAQRLLAGFTARVAAMARDARKSAQGGIPSWVPKADRLLACRHVELLREVLPQMRLLAVSVMGGLLLMLLAVASYPFQIRDRLMVANWVIILLAVAVLLRALVQMNRDPVLSALTHTDPNRVSWTRDFIIRILMYGVLPLLGLLGAQFPETVGSWLPFVNQFLGTGRP